jgi:endonuclease YncB( thermonuclease family)
MGCFNSKSNENIESNIKLNLLNTNIDEVKYFTFKNMVFDALPCNIYDGDTFSAVFVFNNRIIKYRCRCLGYDTAEMKPLLSKPNRDQEIELAIKAKNRFIELLEKNPNKLIKIECFDFDKYGRILVKIYNNIDNESINDIMIKEKHGKPYNGGKKDEY